MVIFGTIVASIVPKYRIIGYLRCHLCFSDLLWCLVWHFLLPSFGLFRSKTKHHEWSNMSGFDISGLSCCLVLVIILGIILASWDPKAGIIRNWRCFGLGIFCLSWCLILLSLLRHHFGIMRFKIGHHQRQELPWFWHLWTLMMPSFGFHYAKMMPNKMPKPQNEWKPKVFCSAIRKLYH